ncbi:MAG TPA: DUF2442 domain-containing protein [Rhizomicrobium sp.]|jgi:hypothetical protein
MVAENPCVAEVCIANTSMIVLLRDGREIATPLSWFPRLASASVEQRAAWEPAAAGHGIHWPLVDEDLSVEGLLQGQTAWFNDARSE